MKPECTTVTGKTVGENLENVAIPKNQDVISFPDNPISNEGGIAVLKGSLSTKGSVVKNAGIDINNISGPANVFDSEQDALDALFNGDIEKGQVVVIRNEGPKGGPGMRHPSVQDDEIYFLQRVHWHQWMQLNHWKSE